MRTKDKIAHHRFSFLCALCVICALVLSGCAIAPRGPVVSHSVERFAGRPDGLISREEWRDSVFTRGYYLLADPKLSALTAWHTNQIALGGCSHFTCGTLSITVDTNTASIISAGGTAAGNVLGAAVKAAAK